MLVALIITTIFVAITIGSLLWNKKINLFDIRPEDDKLISDRHPRKPADWRASVDLSKTNVTQNGKYEIKSKSQSCRSESNQNNTHHQVSK